jgi:hypothetical protein
MMELKGINCVESVAVLPSGDPPPPLSGNSQGVLMTKTISPAATARNERMRIAAENGAIALAEVRARDIAVRKNMERLRALRLEKEASEPPAETPARKKRAGSARSST